MNEHEGCEPSQCGTLPACAGCHSNPANKQEPEKKKAPEVRKVIGVVSGKGGVGKSLVAAQLAVLLRRKGYDVGILDADITGPSVPKMFGISDKAMGDGETILPASTHNDIKLMSVNPVSYTHLADRRSARRARPSGRPTRPPSRSAD